MAGRFANFRLKCCGEYWLRAAGTFLFSDTIRDNIAFGAAERDRRRCAAAAEAASIADEIEGFPQVINTLVGERGITLSGGQKQRTAIARALIRNPRSWCWMTRWPASIRRPKTAS